MRRRLVTGTMLLLSLVPAPDRADEITIERPFLWELCRPNSDTRSWLFGTIHVNDPGITRLHPLVQSAFDSSTEVWFEIDFANDSARQTRALSLPDGRVLEDVLSQPLVARIDDRLEKLSPLFSRGSLPEFEVVIWPLILANLEAQISQVGKQPLDMQLQASAREANKVTGGLEDPVRQLQVLTDLSLPDQEQFLRASLDVMDEDERENRQPLRQLIRLYASGDEEKLTEFLKTELQRPQISELLRRTIVDGLLTRRNREIAQAIHEKQLARPDIVLFAAVGTAHLVGENSTVAALRDLGYLVERVRSTQPHAKREAPDPAARQPEDVQELSR